MPLKNRTFFTGDDNSLGAKFGHGGAWFQLLGDVPPGLMISANVPDGIKIPIVPGQLYRVPFRELYVFHNVHPGIPGAATPVNRPFYVVAGDKDDVVEVTSSPPLFQVVKNGNALGNVALWTPAAGKRFRLLAFHLMVRNDSTLAIAGSTVFNLADGSGGPQIWQTRLWFPTAAPAAGPALNYDSGLITLPAPGYLSGAAGRILDASLSTALNAGGYVINSYGTEE